MAAITASLVLAAIGIGLSLFGQYAQEAHINAGSNLKKRMEDLAKKIYSKIANNNKLLEKLQTAVQNRNASLVNAVFSQAGFGPAVNALYKEYRQNEDKLKEEKEKVTDENTKMTNEYNQLTNAAVQTGTIAGNKYARETYNQVGQAVEGGLEDYEHKDINPSGNPFTDYSK